ncbi:MAG TPA: ACT domain-containing protein [Thermoanaerobaculia bacterium]|nr:ACT domain-containing protein [Thermoanaerobaculia bacterium]
MSPLRYAVLPGSFAVLRLGPDADVPADLLVPPFHSVTRTPAELSVVCPESVVPAGSRAETGWALLALAGPFPFEMVGVLASVLGPLATAGVSVFALSTFDTDYVLVKRERLADAINALTAAGHERVEAGT